MSRCYRAGSVTSTVEYTGIVDADTRAVRCSACGAWLAAEPVENRSAPRGGFFGGWTVELPVHEFGASTTEPVRPKRWREVMREMVAKPGVPMRRHRSGRINRDSDMDEGIW